MSHVVKARSLALLLRGSWEESFPEVIEIVYKGCSRNYPGGNHIFFSDPSTPRTHKESEPPDPQDT